MQLEADHVLAQTEKHTQKHTFLGTLFAQGMLFTLRNLVRLPSSTRINLEEPGKVTQPNQD